MNRVLASILLTALLAAPTSAQDATTPGEVTLPHPTLEHISIEWAFSGDDDGDGSVSVRFREAGTVAYREAMAARRCAGWRPLSTRASFPHETAAALAATDRPGPTRVRAKAARTGAAAACPRVRPRRRG